MYIRGHIHLSAARNLWFNCIVLYSNNGHSFIMRLKLDNESFDITISSRFKARTPRLSCGYTF